MAQAPEGTSRAIRLTFAYGPDGVQLVARQALAMQVPPTDDVSAAPSPVGLTAELRTTGDDITFRRDLPNAIPRDSEVFEPEGEGGMHRAPVAPETGVFTVLVPDDESAEDLVLVLGTTDVPPSIARAMEGRLEAEGAAAQELARFPLREGGPGGNG